MTFRTGLQTQNDDAHVRLRTSTERDITSTTAADELVERSLALYGELEVIPLPWIRTVLGLRAEEFWFDVNHRAGTSSPAEGEESDGQLLPKLNVILRPFAEDALLPCELAPVRDFELFLNFGKGYHSNDARDVVAEPTEPTLASAYGWEIGARTRFLDRLDVAAAYWWLNLEREFVFVGDAGTTEQKPRSRRRGVEVAAELEILDWLFWQGALGYSSGEFVGARDGADALPGREIPQAVRFIADSGLVARHPSGLSAELSYRTLGQRYSTEDPSTKRLRSWAVWDAAVRYRHGPFEIGLILENLGDTHWESAEFFFESQLAGEAAGVEDLHFVPGNPRNARVVLAYHF
jgi:outer membrane receptor protein involved in Fe transport